MMLFVYQMDDAICVSVVVGSWFFSICVSVVVG